MKQGVEPEEQALHQPPKALVAAVSGRPSDFDVGWCTVRAAADRAPDQRCICNESKTGREPVVGEGHMMKQIEPKPAVKGASLECECQLPDVVVDDQSHRAGAFLDESKRAWQIEIVKRQACYW
jgi:hypothetical protein